MLKTVQDTVKSEYRDRGSKFYGSLYYVRSEDEFEKILQEIKDQYPDATHHCPAWRLNPDQPKEYSSDDGEPSGSAGLPMLNALKSADLIEVAAIVVRYYGGAKLGKSGLIEAYGSTVRLCIEKANLLQVLPVQKLRIRYPYDKENLMTKLISDFNIHILNSTYMEDITLIAAVPDNNSTSCIQYLRSLNYLGIEFEKLAMDYLRLK